MNKKEREIEQAKLLKEILEKNYQMVF